MVREIQLDGGEVTLLKALGTSGSPMFGELLLKRLKEVDRNEILSSLSSMLNMGYIVSNKVNIRLIEDVERAFFRVNGAYARDLRDALRPGRKEKPERGRRRRG